MGRWLRGSGVMMMGGILFNGGCATAPPCPVLERVPTAVAQPLHASSSSRVGLEQKVNCKRSALLTCRCS